MVNTYLLIHSDILTQKTNQFSEDGNGIVLIISGSDTLTDVDIDYSLLAKFMVDLQGKTSVSSRIPFTQFLSFGW